MNDLHNSQLYEDFVCTCLSAETPNELDEYLEKDVDVMCDDGYVIRQAINQYQFEVAEYLISRYKDQIDHHLLEWIIYLAIIKNNYDFLLSICQYFSSIPNINRLIIQIVFKHDITNKIPLVVDNIFTKLKLVCTEADYLAIIKSITPQTNDLSTRIRIKYLHTLVTPSPPIMTIALMHFIKMEYNISIVDYILGLKLPLARLNDIISYLTKHRKYSYLSLFVNHYSDQFQLSPNFLLRHRLPNKMIKCLPYVHNVVGKYDGFPILKMICEHYPECNYQELKKLRSNKNREKLISYLTSHGVPLPTCIVCQEVTGEAVYTCEQCQTPICLSCVKNWCEYQEGEIFNTSRINCVICKHLCEYVLLGIDLNNYTQIIWNRLKYKKIVLDPTKWYYACIICKQIKEYADISCISQPTETKSICEECLGTHLKKCPKCSIQILKTGGCYHVQCSNCSLHFCFNCLEMYDENGGLFDHESIYDHTNECEL